MKVQEKAEIDNFLGYAKENNKSNWEVWNEQPYYLCFGYAYLEVGMKPCSYDEAMRCEDLDD